MDITLSCVSHLKIRVETSFLYKFSEPLKAGDNSFPNKGVIQP